MKKIINVWTDGGARGNPGPAAIGIVVKDGDVTRFESSRFIGQATNNQAEYQAVIGALVWLRSQKITSTQTQIKFYLDSELVVNQLQGRYKVKHENMKSLHEKARILVQSIGGDIEFVAVPRSQNKRADQLVNEALDNAQMVKGF